MKILLTDVGAFVTTLAEQIKAGISNALAQGIFVEPVLEVEVTAEVISSAQSLSEVTVTVQAAYDEATAVSKTVTTTPPSETTTRTGTNNQTSGGEDTNDATYTFEDYS